MLTNILHQLLNTDTHEFKPMNSTIDLYRNFFRLIFKTLIEFLQGILSGK